MHYPTCNKTILQQPILIYGIKYSPMESKEPIVLLYSDLNTNYLYMQMAGHSYSQSRSCDKNFHTFLYFHIKCRISMEFRMRRPGA